MREITSPVGLVSTEFYVIKDVTTEPIKINFVQQIDDIIINSPDGDVLVSWDRDTWDENQTFMVPGKNDVKELNNVRCTTMWVAKAPWVEKNEIRVWICVQRN